MKPHQEKHLTPKCCLWLQAPEKQTAEEYSDNGVVTCLVWSDLVPWAQLVAAIARRVFDCFFKSLHPVFVACPPCEAVIQTAGAVPLEPGRAGTAHSRLQGAHRGT